MALSLDSSIEIIMNQDIVSNTDKTLIEQYIKSNQNHLLFDISLMIKSEGFADEKINTLSQAIRITLSIPEEQRGFKNYQIVRVHDGQITVLETTNDAENHTITFETDQFSTYALVYQVNKPLTFLWWLLLLLLVPIVLYILWKRDKDEEKTKGAHNIINEILS